MSHKLIAVVIIFALMLTCGTVLAVMGEKEIAASIIANSIGFLTGASILLKPKKARKDIDTD